MKKSLLFLLTLILLQSCGPSNSEYQSLLNENLILKSKYEQCLAELEQYKNSPDILYAKAIEYSKDKDINNLAQICLNLKKYHPASPEYDKVVTMCETLEKEIAAQKKAEKEKRMKIVSSLRKKHDDVAGITWYENPYFKHYNNTNHISLYIGIKEGGSPWLRLKMSYHGDDWIFFEKAYLSYDGNTREIPFSQYDDKKSDNTGGGVWEWIDVSVDNTLLDFLKQMVDGKSIKMRLSGKYTHTKDISSTEIKAIKDILLGYDVLLNEK